MLRITFISLFLALGSLVFAQQGALKHTKMSIRGTSTMHDWKSEVVSTKGNATIVKEDSKLTAIENLNITIKVSDLKSDKGSIMDNNTYKAMKSEKYPLITVKMVRTNSVMKTVSGYIIDATCEVSIAGLTRKMNINCNAFDQPNGDIVITGTKLFKMTDFNIKPPVIFMGALKTADDITLEFTTVISGPQDT